MSLATPEQLWLFKRRRAGALLIEVVALVLAPIFAVTVLVVLGVQSNVSKVVAAVAFVAVFFIGQLTRHACFRCPVCAGSLPKAPRYRPLGNESCAQCLQCRTTFSG